MTHENLTPYSAIPLNKNMEGNNDPESLRGGKEPIRRTNRGQAGEESGGKGPPNSRQRARDREILRRGLREGETSKNIAEELLSPTSTEDNLRAVWYRGRNPLDIPADERQAIEAAIATGATPGNEFDAQPKESSTVNVEEESLTIPAALAGEGGSQPPIEPPVPTTAATPEPEPEPTPKEVLPDPKYYIENIKQGNFPFPTSKNRHFRDMMRGSGISDEDISSCSIQELLSQAAGEAVVPPARPSASGGGIGGNEPPAPPASTSPEPEEPDEPNEAEENRILEQRFIEIFEKYGIDTETAKKFFKNAINEDKFIEGGRRVFELGINDTEHEDEQADIFADVFTEGVEGVDKDVVKEALKDFFDQAGEIETRVSRGENESDTPRSQEEIDVEDQNRQLAYLMEYIAKGYNLEEAAKLVADGIPPDRPVDDISEDEKPPDERVSDKSVEQIMKEYLDYQEKRARENEALLVKAEDEDLFDQIKTEREMGADEDSIRRTIDQHNRDNSAEGRRSSLEKYISKRNSKIENSSDSEGVYSEIDSLMNTYGNDLKRFSEKRYEEFVNRNNLLRGITDQAELKKRSQEFVRDISEELHGFGGEKGNRGIEVNHVDDLFQLIMDSEGSEWRTGGEFELIDRAGNRHPENFMAWTRYKTRYFITDYSPDDPINLLNEIAVETPYKNITLGTMYGTPKYFMRRDVVMVKERVMVKNRDGTAIKNNDGKYVWEDKVTAQSRIVSDPTLALLKTRALMEVWPMGENHNADAQYRSAMGQAKMLQETLPKLHYKGLYTKDRARLPSFFRIAGIEDIERRTEDALEGSKFQGDVGKTHQRAINAIRYLPDRYMFRKVFNGGKDTPVNSEALNAYYQSIVEQVFADRMKTIKDEKIEEYKKNNVGRSPTDSDIHINIFGSDSKRFLELLNHGDVADKSLITRPLGLSEEEFSALINNPELFALKAITYRFSNDKGVDFKDLNVIDPKNPYVGIDKITVEIEKRKADLVIAEKTMSHTDAKAARLKLWQEEQALLKDRDKIKNNLDGAYDVFNIFSQVKREDTQIKFVRNAISAGLLKQLQLDRVKKIERYREEVGKLDVNTEDYQDKLKALDYMKVEELDSTDKDYEMKVRRLRKRQELDADIGVLWGIKEAYWTGISAFNDTNAIGFDKWSNEINTKDYRMRQGSGRGPFGLKDTVWGFRRLTFNFWDGLKVRVEGDATLDTPLMEVVQGGAGDEMDLDKEMPLFDFEGNAQRQWMVDHVIPAFKVADFLFDKHGMDLNKYFTRGHNGKLIIDKEKAQELIQDFIWHDFRYIIDQSGFNWDKQMRMWWREYDEKGSSVVRFGSKKTEEYMFDEEVINMKMYGREGVPGSEGARARNAFAYQVSKEIAYHMRDAEGVYKWGLSDVMSVKDYFMQEWGYGQRPVDKKGNSVVTRDGKKVAVDKDGKILYENARVNRVEPAYKFFSEEEWEDKIAGPADAGEGKLRRNLFLNILWIFGISMLWGTVKEGGKTLTSFK